MLRWQSAGLSPLQQQTIHSSLQFTTTNNPQFTAVPRMEFLPIVGKYDDSHHVSKPIDIQPNNLHAHESDQKGYKDVCDRNDES